MGMVFVVFGCLDWQFCFESFLEAGGMKPNFPFLFVVDGVFSCFDRNIVFQSRNMAENVCLNKEGCRECLKQ